MRPRRSPHAMLTFVQRTGQSIFLAIERLFNRAFGESSNPFYNLGAIRN